MSAIIDSITPTHLYAFIFSLNKTTPTPNITQTLVKFQVMFIMPIPTPVVFNAFEKIIGCIAYNRHAAIIKIMFFDAPIT
jgi:hypothetical protein